MKANQQGRSSNGLRLAVLFAALLTTSSLAMGQTTPIPPKTPDIVVPPSVVVPTLGTALAPLTSQEVVRLALRLQPTVDDARGAYESAQGRARQEKSRLYPTVGVTGSLARDDSVFGGNAGLSSTGTSGIGTSGTGTNGGTTSGGTIGGTTGTTGGTTGTTNTGNSTSFSNGGGGGLFTSGRIALAVSQLLYDFGRTRDLVRQQQSLASAAGFDYTRAQLDAALNARQRLADLAQNHRLVGVAEANVRERQDQLRLAAANFESGLYPPKDVVDAKTNLSIGVAALITARANETMSRIQLAQAIGIDPRTPLTAADESLSTAVPADPTELFTTALTLRPEVKQARRTVEAAGFGVSAAKKTASPSISASASLGTSGTTDPFQGQTTAVGLSIDWPFFDSGFTAGAVQEARGTQRSALAQYRLAQQTAVADVGQAYLDLASAVQRVVVGEAGVVNAAEGVRLAEGRYRGGVGGTFLDITNAQAQLYTAQQTLETSRGDVVRAQAALDRAVGRGV